jgi:hypothetical protein
MEVHDWQIAPASSGSCAILDSSCIANYIIFYVWLALSLHRWLVVVDSEVV